MNSIMNPSRSACSASAPSAAAPSRCCKRNQEEIRRRAGRGIEITMVADLDVERAPRHRRRRVQVVADAREVIANPDIDIVVELIGGYGIAKALVLEAIAAGKHVVTANKALLAVHGTEIFAAARAKGVMVAFEAAVAGGIPIIKALREGLTANRIEWIAGIINGTTNFILSEMRSKGLDFAVVLKEAQRLGYAEADPTFDIEGVDAAHKATIMSAIAFGMPVQFDKAHVEGITALQAADIRYAEQLGYRIKLLGITKRRDDAGIELRVHPTLMPAKRLIANVEGAMNAVVVQGDAVGTTLYYGKGAGASRPPAPWSPTWWTSPACTPPTPTTACRTWPSSRASWQDTPILPIDEVVTAFYLRLRVADEAGVLAASPASWPTRHLDRRRAAARERRGREADRPHHPDARHRGRPHEGGAGADAGAADGAGADRAHPQGRTE
jgi:homoserine dehydrogenase